MSEPPPGRILAIDTASDAVSLAIESDGALRAEHSFQVETTVSRELLGELDAFRLQNRLRVSEQFGLEFPINPSLCDNLGPFLLFSFESLSDWL